MELRAALADPRARLGLGLATLLATVGAVHRDHVGACEATAFQAVNGLPDGLYPPAWAVMQLGAFGAVPAAATVAWRAGDRELAERAAPAGEIRAGIGESPDAGRAVRPHSGSSWGAAPRPRRTRPNGGLPWPM